MNLAVFHDYSVATDPKVKERLRNRLVVENLPLVQKFVLRFREGYERLGVDVEDVTHCGIIGLILALDAFDPTKASFSTFAYFKIRFEIQNLLDRAPVIARTRKAKMAPKVVEAGRKIRLLHGRNPTALELGITERRLKSWSKRVNCVSLSSPVAGSVPFKNLRGLPDEMELVDTIASTTPDPYESLYGEDLKAKLRELLDALPEIERKLIEETFIEGRPCADVARELGIYQRKAARIRTRVMEQLKTALEGM